MTERDSRIERAQARDAGMRRLQKLTFVGVAGATALGGLFAGIAAKAVPGRTTTTRAQTSATTTRARTRTRTETLPATPAPIVPANGSSPVPQTQAPSQPSAPAQAPVQSPAPPVVVSGGS